MRIISSVQAYRTQPMSAIRRLYGGGRDWHGERLSANSFSLSLPYNFASLREHEDVIFWRNILSSSFCFHYLMCLADPSALIQSWFCLQQMIMNPYLLLRAVSWPIESRYCPHYEFRSVSPLNASVILKVASSRRSPGICQPAVY